MDSLGHIGWVEGVGYLASLLVFCTFYMKTMLPLRGVALASNVAFMTYGLAGGLYPVFLLHVILLPLNCLRLHQLRGLIRKVREASRGDLCTEWLIPLMTRRTLGKGEVLFRMGDPGHSMHLAPRGRDQDVMNERREPAPDGAETERRERARDGAVHS